MKASKENILRYSEWAAFLIWGVLCFVYFHTNYYYHFFYQEQNQLFLMSWEYIRTYFSEEAPLALLVGDFLTQFYYYVFAGPAILALSLLLMGIMARATISTFVRKDIRWTSTLASLLLITIEAALYLSNTHRLSDVWSAVGWSIMLCMAASMGRVCYERSKTTLHKVLCAIPIAISLIVAYIGFGNPVRGEFTKPEKGIERLLAYDNEYQMEHYSNVISMGLRDKNEMTDNECFFYFLSLSHMGSISYSITEIEKPFLGTFVTIGSDTPLFTIKMINELYYVLGDMTYAERAALMACTFSPNNRNVRMIKRLAEINLIKGDDKAATKYLRLLSKTIAYRQWAKDHTPGTQTDKVKQMIADKRKMMNTCDGIRLGDNCRTILLELLDSNRNNKVALDYLLCSDMLAGDKLSFREDYEKYGPCPEALYQQTYQSLLTTPNQTEQ